MQKKAANYAARTPRNGSNDAGGGAAVEKPGNADAANDDAEERTNLVSTPAATRARSMQQVPVAIAMLPCFQCWIRLLSVSTASLVRE